MGMTDVKDQHRQLPRLSIITPSLNRAQYVAEAIDSVLCQGYPNFEHIIIDGGSMDGTLEVLSQFSHLRLVSEADRGIYDALNKGLKLSLGQVIGFLNTDDVYAQGAFHRIAAAFSKAPVDFVGGRVEIFREDDPTRIAILGPGIIPRLLEKAILEEMPFNGFFFRKSVFERVGGFDDNLRLVADREFMVRVALASLSGIEIPQVVYRYRDHPGSLTFGMDDRKARGMLDDELQWTGKYLRQRGFPAKAKNLLSELRVRGTVGASGDSLRRGDKASALHYAREGMRYNPSWPLRFIRHALGYFRKRALEILHRTRLC
jgi:glycosyltransferase involved in cell wall biosynthesis